MHAHNHTHTRGHGHQVICLLKYTHINAYIRHTSSHICSHIQEIRSHTLNYTQTWLQHPILNCPYANEPMHIYTNLLPNIFMPTAEFSKC